MGVVETGIPGGGKRTIHKAGQHKGLTFDQMMKMVKNEDVVNRTGWIACDWIYRDGRFWSTRHSGVEFNPSEKDMKADDWNVFPVEMEKSPEPEEPVGILGWFDIYNPKHLSAYRELSRTGQWPEGFIPDNVNFQESWNLMLNAELADAFIRFMAEQKDQKLMVISNSEYYRLLSVENRLQKDQLEVMSIMTDVQLDLCVRLANSEKWNGLYDRRCIFAEDNPGKFCRSGTEICPVFDICPVDDDDKTFVEDL